MTRSRPRAQRHPTGPTRGPIASSVQLALGEPHEAQDSIERALELSPDGLRVEPEGGGAVPSAWVSSDLAEDRFLAAVRAAANGSGDQRAAQKSLEHTRRMQRKSIRLGSRLPDTEPDSAPGSGCRRGGGDRSSLRR